MVRHSTWIMLVVFVILIGSAWLFQRYQSDKTDFATTTTPTPTLTNIYDLIGRQVNVVIILDSNGEKIEFNRISESEQWSIANIPLDQMDSFQIESNFAQLFSIKVQETLTHTPPLDAIGLVIPAYTIGLKTVDGESIITYVGSLTPIGRGYYVRVDSGPIVIVDNVVLDEVINMFVNPPLIVTPTPKITTAVTILPTETIIQKTPTP